jgi:GT2 family glycosyltransferase
MLTAERDTVSPILAQARATTSAPLATVSIVSHEQWALVRPLLEQLTRLCRGSVAKIVLTLNAPEQVDLDLQTAIPIDIVRNEHPKGFGANHNAAFAKCETPWFLVLNPDIRLDGDIIATMLERAEPSTGLLAPRIQEPGKPELEPFRDVLTPAELLLRRLPRYRPPEQPAWIAGMFMLVRSEVFASLGGFDERFYMYCEDFDFCARLRLGGWKLQVVHDVRATHEAQRASNSSMRPFLWHVTGFLKLWISPTTWQYWALTRRSR